jgi:Sec-independent protein translocase protein TatA
VFEGAFSPWHLLILAVVVFLVVGPKRMAKWTSDLGESVKRLGEDDETRASSAATAADPPPKRRGLAYRLGRFRSRFRRKGRAGT